MKFSMASSDSLLPLLCLCCFLLPVSVVACPWPLHCGYLGDIYFPFDNTTNPSCGLLPISGCGDLPKEPKMVQWGQESFQVVKIIYQKDDQHVIIVRHPNIRDLWRSNPCIFLRKEHPILSFSFLNGSSFLECEYPLGDEGVFDHKCSDSHIYYLPKGDSEWPDPSKECSLIQLPSPYSTLPDEIYIQVHVSPSCFNCAHSRGGQCLRDGRCSADVMTEHKEIDYKSTAIGNAFPYPK